MRKRWLWMECEVGTAVFMAISAFFANLGQTNDLGLPNDNSYYTLRALVTSFRTTRVFNYKPNNVYQRCISTRMENSAEEEYNRLGKATSPYVTACHISS